MMRLLALPLVAAALAPAAPAGAAPTCVGTTTVESWSGVCAGGDGWLVCARDGSSHPVLYVYVPGPDSGGQTCRPA